VPCGDRDRIRARRPDAACLGAERRIWVIGVGRQTSPYQAVTPAQAAVLRPRYRLSLVKRQRSLTMFLLTRRTGWRDIR